MWGVLPGELHLVGGADSRVGLLLDVPRSVVWKKKKKVEEITKKTKVLAKVELVRLRFRQRICPDRNRPLGQLHESLSLRP